MGLLDSLFGDQRMSDPVRAQVVSCSANRGRGVYQNCHLQLVVQAEGVPARAVEQQTLVHRSRWPFPGMTLPATVDRANPSHVRIEWDELPDARDRARRTAEQMAAALRAPPPPPPARAGTRRRQLRRAHGPARAPGQAARRRRADRRGVRRAEAPSAGALGQERRLRGR